MLASAAGTKFASALDPHRRETLERALDQVLEGFEARSKKPQVVLLGWQAATLLEHLHGRAAKIFVVEPHVELMTSIESGLAASGLGADVELLRANLDAVVLPQRVDLALYLSASTWFIDGVDSAVLDHARNRLLEPQGVMLPRRLVHLFELARVPNSVGGLPMRLARFGRPGEPVAVVSESKRFATTDLSQPGPLPTVIDDSLFVRPLLGGGVSGLRLSTVVELAEGIVEVRSSESVQSVLVPLREDVVLRDRQPLLLHIRYEIGAGLAGSVFSARVVHEDEDPATNWPLATHPITAAFEAQIDAMIDEIDRLGRGGDLDKVVSYTLQPHGDVSRLTALSWTVDEEFQKILLDLIKNFRGEASALGQTPSDEVIYEIMLQIYREKRGEDGEGK